MSAINTVNSIITNSPLSDVIEQMGISIAKAQAALDSNSFELLKKLSTQEVDINGEKTNLLRLGFVPTFYAFTEASFETKMEFSMTESTSIEAGGSFSFNKGIVAASVNANFARKFEQSASASSSIAARLVSLPPPENLLEKLRETKI
jgi:hypothetical protein